MVDPTDVTKFNRTESELQEFLLFCTVVAGKTAHIQAGKLDTFLTMDKKDLTPFKIIEYYLDKEILLKKMQLVGLGQYRRLVKCFRQLINLDVNTCTLDQLEEVYGIGPKTARFFLLHSRPNQKLAVLDTHILKWMGEELGVKVPKTTPPIASYRVLEEIYLNHCSKNNLDPATLDLEIWNKYSRKK